MSCEQSYFFLSGHARKATVKVIARSLSSSLKNKQKNANRRVVQRLLSEASVPFCSLEFSEYNGKEASACRERWYLTDKKSEITKISITVTTENVKSERNETKQK